MRITFDTDETAIQWIEMVDGKCVDTNQDNVADAVWRGAEVRNVVIGQPLEYHLVSMPEGEWGVFGGNVVSIE